MITSSNFVASARLVGLANKDPKTPVDLTTRRSNKMGFLQPGVLTTRGLRTWVLTTRSLTSRTSYNHGLTTRTSYNKGSYNQGSYKQDFLQPGSYNKGFLPRGVLPYMGYIGMCRCEGYGFQAVYPRIGYIYQSVWL